MVWNLCESKGVGLNLEAAAAILKPSCSQATGPLESPPGLKLTPAGLMKSDLAGGREQLKSTLWLLHWEGVRKIKMTPWAKTGSNRTDKEGNILPATCSSTVWVATASLSLTLTVYDAVSSVLRSDNWIPASPTCNNTIHSVSPALATYDAAVFPRVTAEANTCSIYLEHHHKLDALSPTLAVMMQLFFPLWPLNRIPAPSTWNIIINLTHSVYHWQTFMVELFFPEWQLNQIPAPSTWNIIINLTHSVYHWQTFMVELFFPRVIAACLLHLPGTTSS